MTYLTQGLKQNMNSVVMPKWYTFMVLFCYTFISVYMAWFI